MRAVPFEKDELAEIIMEVFGENGGLRLPHDGMTAELLIAISSNPAFVRTANTGLLIDRLKELLEDGYSPVEVARIAVSIVEHSGDAIANIATALSASAEDMIDISITLQRFPATRAEGTSIFERLLVANSYAMRKTLPSLDRRF